MLVRSVIIQAEPLAVTIEDAGKLLGYKETKIRDLINAGELEIIGEGQGVRVVYASLKQFVERTKYARA